MRVEEEGCSCSCDATAAAGGGAKIAPASLNIVYTAATGSTCHQFLLANGSSHRRSPILVTTTGSSRCQFLLAIRSRRRRSDADCPSKDVMLLGLARQSPSLHSDAALLLDPAATITQPHWTTEIAASKSAQRRRPNDSPSWPNTTPVMRCWEP